MRIVYSNVIEKNGKWGAEWFLNRAFNDLGHFTYCIDYRKYRNSLFSKFAQAPDSDVFFLQRGDYFPLQIIKSLNIPRLLWISELVDRRHDHNHLLKSKLFDHVFLRTSNCIDKVVAKKWLKHEQCSILLGAFDETYYRKKTVTKKDIDVLFFGTMTPRREKVISKIEKLFSIYTVQVFDESLVDLINRAKIVLNIHAESITDTETRVYEVLGCGGFLLSEQLSEENPFTENEVVQFQSISDLSEKIEYFLMNETKRESIAKQGYIHALAKHTYKHRAQEIVQVMENIMNRTNHRQENIFIKDAQLSLYRLTEPFYSSSVTFRKTLGKLLDHIDIRSL